MDTYQEAYLKLFNAVTDALDALTHAQLDCEAHIIAGAEKEKEKA